LAEALEALVVDAPRRRRLAQALAEHARAHFGEEHVVAQHLEVYRALAGG